MPSLVATTSTPARKPFVRTHYVRTNNNAKFSGYYVCPRTHYLYFRLEHFYEGRQDAMVHSSSRWFSIHYTTSCLVTNSLDGILRLYWCERSAHGFRVRTDVVATKLGIIGANVVRAHYSSFSFFFFLPHTFLPEGACLESWNSRGNLIWTKLEDSCKKKG